MSHVLYLSIHLPCPAEMKLLVCESLQKKKIPFLSPELALDYFLFPSFNSSPKHIASVSSYSHQPLVLLETSLVDHDPRSILRGDILTLLMVLRCFTKKFPPFYSNESACAETHCVDQCTNLNNLSPAACVSNTVSWRDYTVSFFFSPTLPTLWGARWNRSLHSGWWQDPQCPAFGSEAAGIHRDKPDGRYLGQ